MHFVWVEWISHVQQVNMVQYFFRRIAIVHNSRFHLWHFFCFNHFSCSLIHSFLYRIPLDGSFFQSSIGGGQGKTVEWYALNRMHTSRNERSRVPEWAWMWENSIQALALLQIFDQIVLNELTEDVVIWANSPLISTHREREKKKAKDVDSWYEFFFTLSVQLTIRLYTIKIFLQWLVNAANTFFSHLLNGKKAAEKCIFLISIRFYSYFRHISDISVDFSSPPLCGSGKPREQKNACTD